MGQILNKPVLVVPKASKTYQPRYTDYIINWGCSADWEFITNDNKTGHKNVVNKLNFFKCIENYNELNPEERVNIPQWTTNKNVAATFAGTVVCRTVLNGHSGMGIILADPAGVIPNAPLYVAYKKKKHEYRVHFFRQADGTYKVVDVTQKKKRKGVEHDTQIRNHANGWVYCREDITEPDDLRTQALRAATACGMQFGAVDLIYNQLEDTSYVLEINTAPGLVGTTLSNYVETFYQDIIYHG